MCRVLAYQGPAKPLSKLIYLGERSFVSQSKRAFKSITPVNADGFGIGWFGEDFSPKHYRDTLPAWGDDNLRNISEHIQSPTLFAHIRASTETETSRANCHPFIHKQWMFMHNGQIPEFLKLRRKIESWIADEDYPARIGTTDSEALFLSFFALGLEQNPIAAVAQALQQSLALMQTHDIPHPIRFTSVLSNGRQIYAFRYATDDAPPSLFYQHCGEYLLIVSEPIDDKLCDWQSLPCNHVLIAQDHQIRLEKFSPH